MKYLVTFLFATQLMACSTFGLFTADKPIRERITDAKIILAATAQEIRSNVESGLMTPDDAQEKIGQVIENRDKLNRLQGFIGIDSDDALELRLNLINRTVFGLQKYVADKAQEAK